MKVLFVCLGNICRSPMAEAMFRQMIAQITWPIKSKSTQPQPAMKKKATARIQARLRSCISIICRLRGSSRVPSLKQISPLLI